VDQEETMVRYDVIEWFPDQILSLEGLRDLLEEVTRTFAWPWSSKRAEREWRRLAEMVREAMEETFILGVEAKERWLPRIHDCLENLESKKGISERGRRDVRAAYITFLDRIYGAIFRHVLLHMPTALCTEAGHFRLNELVVFRYARLRDGEKPALEELLEFLYLGGPRFEMLFSWKPLGGKEEEEPPLLYR